MCRVGSSSALVVCVASFVLLASVVQAQSNPPCPPTNSNNSSDPSVTTWHYDNCRTGWQQNETILNTTTVNHNGTFGKIMQYNVQGAVYAQPLAVYQVSNSPACPGGVNQPCNMVFIATEEDMLYAFNADYAGSQTPTPLWSLNLAPNGGTYLDCNMNNPPLPCPGIKPYIGVTGTPVIDTTAGILYVVSIVYFSSTGAVQYWIHAVNYKTGMEMSNSNNNPYQIVATVPGQAPGTKCGTAPSSGTISFDADHYQRAGLLLLNGEVYVAFAPADSEEENGWLMAFSYNSSTGFSIDDEFVTTPYGTGGGIWMSAAGIAAESGSNGTYIYVSVANGTFDKSGAQNLSTDYGDSVIKLSQYLSGTTNLAEADYFTPSNVFSFTGGNGKGKGLCIDDEDLGSGGVMLFPDSVVTGHPYLLITADKQSNFYVIDRDNLTGYNSSGDTIVQELLTPQGPNGQEEESGQGYWGSPAYWEWTASGTTKRAIYYSVDATDAYGAGANYPLPMNMYILNPGTMPRLIPTTPDYPTPTAFCGHGGAPSVSSSTSAPYAGAVGTGIVWAYEDSYSLNPNACFGGTSGPAVLHAYDASNISTELYTSSALTSTVGPPTKFSTPVVFNGRVYIGTQSEVDVFGLCGNPNPACFTN